VTLGAHDRYSLIHGVKYHLTGRRHRQRPLPSFGEAFRLARVH
jgi:hypothetical protein